MLACRTRMVYSSTLSGTLSKKVPHRCGYLGYQEVQPLREPEARQIFEPSVTVVWAIKRRMDQFRWLYGTPSLDAHLDLRRVPRFREGSV